MCLIRRQICQDLPGVVEGVDEEEGSGTSHTTGGKVTHHPLGIAITLLLEGEHRLVGVAEGKLIVVSRSSLQARSWILR
jgi:hypothetical protein